MTIHHNQPSIVFMNKYQDAKMVDSHNITPVNKVYLIVQELLNYIQSFNKFICNEYIALFSNIIDNTVQATSGTKTYYKNNIIRYFTDLSNNINSLELINLFNPLESTFNSVNSLLSGAMKPRSDIVKYIAITYNKIDIIYDHITSKQKFFLLENYISNNVKTLYRDTILIPLYNLKNELYRKMIFSMVIQLYIAQMSFKATDENIESFARGFIDQVDHLSIYSIIKVLEDWNRSKKFNSASEFYNQARQYQKMINMINISLECI